jgi:hypothetical protein
MAMGYFRFPDYGSYHKTNRQQTTDTCYVLIESTCILAKVQISQSDITDFQGRSILHPDFFVLNLPDEAKKSVYIKLVLKALTPLLVPSMHLLNS